MDFSSFQISSDDCQMQCQEADHMNSSSFQFSLENYQERYQEINHMTSSSFQFFSEIHQDEYQFHLENYQKRDQGTDHISQLIYLLNEKESQLEAANAFLIFLQNSLAVKFILLNFCVNNLVND
ncbi:10636_t:CDS:2 [Gigaspora margarita]|uniref:10636_t:CDS:1 n=1 Tax=Gigaspora margarita TaxID=4874 RepID=A0ABM8W3V2_GIGMA|nr:10636_t:CDS:2 [Gigaspora margarita]